MYTEGTWTIAGEMTWCIPFISFPCISPQKEKLRFRNLPEHKSDPWMQVEVRVPPCVKEQAKPNALHKIKTGENPKLETDVFSICCCIESNYQIICSPFLSLPWLPFWGLGFGSPMEGYKHSAKAVLQGSREQLPLNSHCGGVIYWLGNLGSGYISQIAGH